jgi:hypothetical protein
VSEKLDAKAGSEKIPLRVEGLALITRLQELLRKEPELKLEIVAPRVGSPRPAATEVK